MFGLDPLGLFVLIILGMVIIGPKMLPASVEGVWLALTNLQRSQRNEGPLSMEEARVIWKASGSMLYQLVQTLNAVVEHLEELRGRFIKIIITMGIGTLICLIFYNQIYALLLKPIAGLTVPVGPNEPKSSATILVLNQPTVITTTVTLTTTNPLDPLATNTITSTVPAQITLPKGTKLSVDQPTLPTPVRPVFLKVTEMFTTSFKIAILGGIALALPVIIYQIVAFIWPALIYENEKRSIYFIIPFASVFFVAGVLFAYFFLLPFALKYLLTFGNGIAMAMPAIGEYISFTTNLMFWIGMVFQTPLVVYFLARLHIVTYEKLKSYWKIAFLISFVVGALITPTPDPINQSLVAGPIFLLYLLGLLLARFA